MRIYIFTGGMGALVAFCGYSVLNDWQAWALIFGSLTLHVATQRKAE